MFVREIATIKKIVTEKLKQEVIFNYLNPNEILPILLNDVKNYFSFVIKKPHFLQTKSFSERRVCFEILVTTGSEIDPGIRTILNGTAENVKIYLTNWIALVKEYYATSLTDDEKILIHYENEFFNEFKIVDEDADVTPYSYPQQQALFNFLENVKKGLIENKGSGDVELLIKEASDLQSSLQELPKNATVKRFSKFAANIRKAGISLAALLWSEGPKVIIKKIIEGGLELGRDIIHHIPFNP